MFDAPLIAAKDWGQAIIPILFLLVWIIGAAARWFAQQQQQQQQREAAPPPMQRRPLNKPLEKATDAEIEEFVRQYVGEKPAAPKPKPSPSRPKIGNTSPQERRTVETRHLHSQLEERHGQEMHSRLESKHLHASNVATELTAMGAEGQVASRARRGNRFIGTMLDRKNIARAMILGQILQKPAGQEGDAIGPPAGMQR